jgi:hypothetical protein
MRYFLLYTVLLVQSSATQEGMEDADANQALSEKIKKLLNNKPGKPLNFDNEEEVLKDESPNAVETQQLLAHLLEGDILIDVSERNAVKKFWQRWPNADIPYQISAQFNHEERQVIKEAMLNFHTDTCIRFIPYKSTDTDYIDIDKGSGCFSQGVGVKGGKQLVSIGDYAMALATLA